MARGHASDSAHRPDPTTATTLFLAFWGFVALFLAITFLVTRAPVDLSSMRYLVSGFIAIAATVPFLTLRAPRRAAAIAVAVAMSGVLGAVLLQRATLADFNELVPQPASGLIAALEGQGLQHGYAGYWQADLLTWESDGRVVVRSVQQSPACQATQPGWFCPYQFFTISDWFAPQPGPSFLVRESGRSFVPNVPPADVRPISVFSYDRFEIFVYDHDIASDAALHTTGWPG